MRRACSVVLLAAAAFATASHAAAPASEEDALAAGGVAGEIMDIAVAHCRRGERREALAMFEAIRAQLDPPPAIRQLILDMEATGCNAVPYTSGGQFRVQAGGGWDSNVSQGITTRTLVLGSGDQTIELELDPSYRPRSAAFAQASVDYSLALPQYGVGLQVGLNQRVNFGASAFDLRTASASASKEFQVAGGRAHAQVEAVDVWLGDRSYQRTATGSLQWLYSTREGAWLATVQASAVHYITQPLQDAILWEAGLLREWQLSPTRSVNVGLSLQRDDARDARPGGDRLGFQVQAGAVVLTQGWRLRPQVAYSYWNSADVFAPALIDVKRRNRLLQTSLRAERPLWANTSLVVEWRGRWARDTVSLYRYQAQMVSASLAYRF